MKSRCLPDRVFSQGRGLHGHRPARI